MPRRTSPRERRALLELYEALKASGIKKGTRMAIRISNRTFHGTVIDILPGYLIIKTNPEEKKAIIRLRDIKYFEIE